MNFYSLCINFKNSCFYITHGVSQNEKKEINRHISKFCILVLGFGALGYIPWVLSSYRIIPFYLGLIFMIIGGASPILAAVITVKKQFGKVDYLFKQFSVKGTSKFLIILSVFLPLIINSIVILIFLLFGGKIGPSKLKIVEFVPYFIIMILYNIWEEIGWRGYLLPSLQSKFNPLSSTLMVGLIWGFWHWPHFLVKNSEMLQNYNNYFIFLTLIILGSVIYTYLYNSSNGNLWTVTFFHASGNASGVILFMNLEINTLVYPYSLLVYSVFSLVLIIWTKGALVSPGRKITDIFSIRNKIDQISQ